MKYEVTVIRMGSVFVEANSKVEAMAIAENQKPVMSIGMKTGMLLIVRKTNFPTIIVM